MKYGYYRFFGNTLEYWGGDFAYDIDAAQQLPVGVLYEAKYLGEEL